MDCGLLEKEKSIDGNGEKSTDAVEDLHVFEDVFMCWMQKAHQVERIEGLWLAGKLVREIMEILDVDYNTLSRTLRRQGLPMRYFNSEDSRVNMWPYIVSWIKAGFTEEEIKAGLGYTGPRKWVPKPTTPRSYPENTPQPPATCHRDLVD